MKALFDTNILIDFLNGHELARKEVRRYPEKAVSIITWIEVMAGATEETEAPCRALLAVFERLELTPSVAERAIILRRESRLKLPDAVILGYCTSRVIQPDNSQYPRLSSQRTWDSRSV